MTAPRIIPFPALDEALCHARRIAANPRAHDGETLDCAVDVLMGSDLSTDWQRARDIDRVLQERAIRADMIAIRAHEAALDPEPRPGAVALAVVIVCALAVTLVLAWFGLKVVVNAAVTYEQAQEWRM